MSEKKVLIKHGGSNAKVKFNDYDSLMSNTTKKLKISTEFDLEYEEDGEWIAIMDDDDVEDLTNKSKLRLVVKKTEGAGRVNTTANEGAAANQGNAQYARGNVSGNMVGGNYIDGDKITAKHQANVKKNNGPLYIGSQPTRVEQQVNTRTISGGVTNRGNINKIAPADPLTDESDESDESDDDKKKH